MRFVLFSNLLLLLPLSHIYGMDSNGELEEDLLHLPVRRSIHMDDSIALSRLQYGDTATKLITMITCFPEYAKELHLRESKIIRLIRENQGASNPYSDSYNAYLITLAARYGHVNIVKAIAEYNPDSIRCFYTKHRGEKIIEGETPLDEAVLFKRKKVARFLHSLKAPLKKVNQQQLDTLLSD